MKRILFSLLAILFSIQQVFASDLPMDVRTALKGTYDLNYISVLGALLFVLLLIYFTGIIYTKLNILGKCTLKKQMKGYEEDSIIIHSTTPIGQNKTLMVIEVAEKKLLIASTQNSVNLIKDLSSDFNSDNEICSSDKKSDDMTRGLEIDKIYSDENIDESIEIAESGFNLEGRAAKSNKEDAGIYKKYL